MAYSEALAERVRQGMAPHEDVVEKKMFGGLCFMLHGHMVCGVSEERLMLRLGKEAVERALSKPSTAPMDFTGSPMKTMIWVLPEGIATSEALQLWLDQATEYVMSLPPK